MTAEDEQEPDGSADGQEPDGSTDEQHPVAQRRVVKEGYEAVAATYARERTSLADAPLVDRFHDEAPAGPILDAGCGAGEPLLSTLAEFRDVIGLDFSREQVARASAVVPGRVLQGDMTALPLTADSVAGVAAMFSIIHVPAAETPTVYEEFARVLEPGGVALVTVGTENWSGRNDDWLDGGAAMEWSILGPDETTEMMRDVGLHVYDSIGIVDNLGEDDRDPSIEDLLVDPDDDRADKLFLFARRED